MKTVSCVWRMMTVVLLPTVALFGCGGGGGGGSAPPNNPSEPPPPPLPTVVVAPAPAGTVNRTLPLSATVTAPSGVTVTMVEFLVDGTVIGNATAEPYTIDWDTSAVADGEHAVTARATDSSARTATSSAVTYTVLNNPVIHVELSNAEVLPAIESSATGEGDITFNLLTGAVAGGVTLEGITATLAHIHRGFAGDNGPVVVDFVQDPADPNRWNAVADGALSPEDVDNLLAGALYVNVHSAAHPTGEIRGQLKPENITVVFSPMSNDQVVPAAPDAASGTVAATIDTASGTATVHAVTSALVEPTEAHVHSAPEGENAPDVVFALAPTQADPNHWFAERQAVSAEQLQGFTENRWYADVHTSGLPDGAVRGQIVATPPAPPPPPAAVTLSQLQAEIFTPICSACHNGSGAALPGSMNLSDAAATFAALVGVASSEQPAVLRVAPGDAANSYLIHKLEGAPSITGARMPLGGPFLDEATIARVRQWIDAGAMND